jgi:hypothetical protein
LSGDLGVSSARLSLYGVFDRRGESIWSRAERWIGFLLKVLAYHAAFVVGGVIAVAEDAAYFVRSFLAWAEGRQVGTGTFDTWVFDGRSLSCGHNVGN